MEIGEADRKILAKNFDRLSTAGVRFDEKSQMLSGGMEKSNDHSEK